MNRNVQSLIIWIAFLGLAILMGWQSDVFQNRAFNMMYEIGFLVGGAALVVVIFAALNTWTPRHSRILPWLFLGAIIAAFIFAKIQVDDHFRGRSEASSTVMMFPDSNGSLNLHSFQRFSLSQVLV